MVKPNPTVLEGRIGRGDTMESFIRIEIYGDVLTKKDVSHALRSFLSTDKYNQVISEIQLKNE